MGLDGLVAADVDPRTRKERQHFVEDVFHERDGRFVCVQQIGRHAPERPRFNGVARAAELGVRGDHGLRMSRHFNFRNDRHESISRIRDDLSHIVLPVKSAVPDAVELSLCRVAHVMANQCFFSPRPNVGQFRISLDLEPPSLVVGQVPVKAVEFVHREQIDVFLDERHEMTGDVEMRAAPRETRNVFNGQRRQRPRGSINPRRSVDVDRQQLPDGLQAVEHARRMSGANNDRAGCHRQPVALRSKRFFERSILLQLDRLSWCRRTDANREIEPGRGVEHRS